MQSWDGDQIGAGEEQATEGGAEAGANGGKELCEPTIKTTHESSKGVVDDGSALLLCLPREVLPASDGVDDRVGGLHGCVWLRVFFLLLLLLLLLGILSIGLNGVLELWPSLRNELIHDPGSDEPTATPARIPRTGCFELNMLCNLLSMIFVRSPSLDAMRISADACGHSFLHCEIS